MIPITLYLLNSLVEILLGDGRQQTFCPVIYCNTHSMTIFLPDKQQDVPEMNAYVKSVTDVFKQSMYLQQVLSVSAQMLTEKISSSGLAIHQIYELFCDILSFLFVQMQIDGSWTL